MAEMGIWYVPHDVEKMTTSGLEREKEDLICGPFDTHMIVDRVGEIEDELYKRWKRGEISSKKVVHGRMEPYEHYDEEHRISEKDWERLTAGQNRKTEASPPKRSLTAVALAIGSLALLALVVFAEMKG